MSILLLDELDRVLGDQGGDIPVLVKEGVLLLRVVLGVALLDGLQVFVH